MTSSSSLAKQLIGTVAKAFYSDTIIAVIDLFLRESFVLDEEIAPRLRLPTKEVKRIVTQLVTEQMLKSEDVSVEGTKDSFKYYYIDYQTCVNVIRYRVYMMQSRLNEEINQQKELIYFECPNCSSRYGMLEVPNLLSGDGKFICTFCCPDDNYKQSSSEPWYRLQEVDNRRSSSDAQSLRSRVDAQLTKIDGMHEGILDLLIALRSSALPHNLPSDNLSKGFQASRVNDMDVQEEIESNLNEVMEGKRSGGSYIRKKKEDISGATAADRQRAVEAGLMNQRLAGSGETIEDQLRRRHESAQEIYRQRDTSLPSFLQGSRVSGTLDVVDAVVSTQAQRAQIGGVTQASLLPDAKRQKVNVGEITETVAPVGDEDPFHGVDWEADEEE